MLLIPNVGGQVRQYGELSVNNQSIPQAIDEPCPLIHSSQSNASFRAFFSARQLETTSQIFMRAMLNKHTATGTIPLCDTYSCSGPPPRGPRVEYCRRLRW